MNNFRAQNMKGLSAILCFLILLQGFSTINVFTKLKAPKTNFTIDIFYFIQPHIKSLHYSITQDSLILYFCKTASCNDSTILSIKLSENQSINYYDYIQSLKLDTLNTYYDGGGFDGTDFYLKIRDESGLSKTIYMHNLSHPIIKLLIDKTNEIIPLERYKIKQA